MVSDLLSGCCSLGSLGLRQVSIPFRCLSNAIICDLKRRTSSSPRAPAGAAEKTTQPRRMFRPSCELKTCTPATRSAWASGHFSGQTAGAILLLVVGVTPTGNRDAGKFATDATQLPTGCQPGSLAKPAHGRSHKAARPQLLTRRARLDDHSFGTEESQACRRRLRPP
jgi:hypothetical protein